MVVSRSLRAVLLIVAFLAAAAGMSAQEIGVDVGDRPPNYLGRSTNGNKLYVTDSEGQILIVTFWASWCAPCLKELPVLNAIQKKAGANRVRVVAVNLKEPRKQFRRAMRAFKDFEVTFVHDERGGITRDFNVKGVPNLFIIDVDGRIAFHHVGYSDAALEGIVVEINALLVKNQLH